MKIIIFSIAMFFAFQYSYAQECVPDFLNKSHTEPERELEISFEQLKSGYNFNLEDRFNLCSIFFKGKNVTEYFSFDPKLKSTASIKLISPDRFDIRNGSVFKVYFTDERFFVFLGDVKLIKFKITKDEPPCDSISYIIYKSISKKIKEYETGEKLTTKNLFDKTVQNEIQNYIESLSSVDRKALKICQKKFFILDVLTKDSEYGFESNLYDLTPQLLVFLNTLAKGVAYELSKNDWSKSKIVFTVEGFTDRLKYRVDQTSSIPEEYKINHSSCGLFDFSNNLFQKDISPLNILLDNCDLSIARSYVAAKYFHEKFTSISDVKASFRYKGLGEINTNTHPENRKIDVLMEIKAVSEDK